MEDVHVLMQGAVVGSMKLITTPQVVATSTESQLHRPASLQLVSFFARRTSERSSNADLPATNRRAMGQSVLRILPAVRGLSHRQPSWDVYVRALHAPSHTARSSLNGTTGLSASRVAYLDYPRPEASLYSLIKPSSFRAYTSNVEKKEPEADSTESREKKSYPLGGRADRRIPDTSTMTLEDFEARVDEKVERVCQERFNTGMGLLKNLTILAMISAMLYACLMDRTIRDPEGNEIATLNPFAYIRCRVFLKGGKSLQEYARAKAVRQDEEYKKSKMREEMEKKDKERERKAAEEEIMMKSEERERIRISIPNCLVRKLVTATTKEEWDGLQKDAKALLAAEVEKKKAELLKERHMEVLRGWSSSRP